MKSEVLAAREKRKPRSTVAALSDLAVSGGLLSLANFAVRRLFQTSTAFVLTR
jgi:hypothetical protein